MSVSPFQRRYFTPLLISALHTMAHATAVYFQPLHFPVMGLSSFPKQRSISSRSLVWNHPQRQLHAARTLSQSAASYYGASLAFISPILEPNQKLRACPRSAEEID